MMFWGEGIGEVWARSLGKERFWKIGTLEAEHHPYLQFIINSCQVSG